MSEQETPVEVVHVQTSRSASIAALAAALAKAQGAMGGAKKDSFNPAFKSNYADLAACWEPARAPLSANGLAVIQLPSTSITGVRVESLLAHSSGEWISCTLDLAVRDRSPHATGTAITYARRFTFSAMVGIAAEDDDGNAASAVQPNGANKSKTADVKAQVAARAAAAKTETPWERIAAALAKAGKADAAAADFVKGVTGKPNRAALTDADAQKVLDALDVLKQENAPAH